MPTDRLVLYGAGGHAAVVLDAMSASAVLVVDGNAALAGQYLLGQPIKAPVEPEELAGHRFHIAIGDNAVRKGLWLQMIVGGAKPITVVHPAASVSPAATLADGCFIAAQAVVAPCAQVEQGSIINHGTVVDHDCRVGEFSHIAPNATLGGNVVIGNGTLIGAGATILPGIRVGSGVIIGAGAVVNRDVPDGEVWVGIPARRKTQDDNA